MNLLDIFIIVIVLAATVRGIGAGLFRQIGSLGGFVIGLLVGAVAAPAIASYLPLTGTRSLLVLLLFLSIAVIFSGIGETLGDHASGLMDKWRLGSLDGGLGAAFGFAASLLGIWLLAASFASSAGSVLAADISSSTILQTLDRTLPPAPDVTAKLERAIGASRFPKVFAGLEPQAAPPVTGPNAAAVNAAVAAAGAATVKIEGIGCGGVLDGSGFVVGDGLVATNAHVVAGIDRPMVIDRAGRHRATVVDFNPDIDIAVLRTAGLAAAPIAIDTHNEPRGTIGAALGYPGGGPFTAGAAAILELQTAVGRNIYDAGLVRRDIYVLQAVVRPGNSGGPLVAPDGTVIGVIFATSTRDPNVGYALTSAEIIPDINAGRTSAPVSSGACLAE
ncbi:MAG: MarP family serine protease [Candidatus Saccharimonadales bacterium]